MARRYAVNGDQTTASPVDSTLSLTGTTAVRNRLYDLTFGFQNTPADRAYEHVVQIISADGSCGDTPVIQPLDEGDPAAVGTYFSNHSIEPTYTTTLIYLNIAANMRATYRWVASPGGEFVMAASATAGIGIFATGNTADEHRVSAHFEQ